MRGAHVRSPGHGAQQVRLLERYPSTSEILLAGQQNNKDFQEGAYERVPGGVDAPRRLLRQERSLLPLASRNCFSILLLQQFQLEVQAQRRATQASQKLIETVVSGQEEY